MWLTTLLRNNSQSKISVLYNCHSQSLYICNKECKLRHHTMLKNELWKQIDGTVSVLLSFKARMNPSLACFIVCEQWFPQLRLWLTSWQSAWQPILCTHLLFQVFVDFALKLQCAADQTRVHVFLLTELLGLRSMTISYGSRFVSPKGLMWGR